MTGALDGIRVIDFGQYLAGPLAALLLADQDAEVIRVDPPGGPRWRHPANAVLQRGKRSIVLDLKSPDDLAIARDLVASSDVVIENFRPGVMDRLGLGPLATTERHRQRAEDQVPMAPVRGVPLLSRTGCSPRQNPPYGHHCHQCCEAGESRADSVHF